VPSRVIETSQSGAIPQHEFKYNPLKQVRVLYVSYVKGLFAQAQPGQYHWSDGPESEIFIADENPIVAENIGERPAISFTRSSIQFSSLGLDDMLSYDFTTGKKTKSVLVPGVMSINCCARNDLESEHIAWVVAEHLWLLREYLMKLGFFEIGRNLNVSAPSAAGSLVSADAGQEWYCTTVASPFQFPRTSQFTPLNKTILQHIELQLHAQLTKAISLGYPGSPNANEYPVNVHTCPPPAFVPNASDAHGRTPDPAGLAPAPPPLIPHPLNPAVHVVLRHTSPHRPGIRPPSLGGRAIPIADPCVEQSVAKSISNVKV
jgi:hypothetical protein